MPQFTDITGLAGCTLAAVAVLLSLPGLTRRPNGQRVLLGLVAAIVLLVPFGPLPAAAYVRGMIGDLSITSVVLLTLAMMRLLSASPFNGEFRTPSPSGGGLGWGRDGGRYALLFIIVLAALALYPMALGWGHADPYRLGYGDPQMLGALLLLAVAAWWGRYPLAALCIALAVLAWGVGWYESTNLWDYLLDPLLALYAIGSLLWRGQAGLRRG